MEPSPRVPVPPPPVPPSYPPGPPYSQNYPYAPPPYRGPDHRLRNIVIVVGVIVVVGVVVVAALYRSSVLTINVASNHISYTVTYVVDLDGQQIDTGSLPAGYEVQLSVPLSWWLDSCQSHQVDASSTGGGTGPMSDSALVSVCASTPASVTLRV